MTSGESLDRRVADGWKSVLGLDAMDQMSALGLMNVGGLTGAVSSTAASVTSVRIVISPSGHSHAT